MSAHVTERWMRPKNLQELIEALEDARAIAESEKCRATEVLVAISNIKLMTEQLSDGSQVFNVEIRMEQ